MQIKSQWSATIHTRIAKTEDTALSIGENVK